VLQVLKNKGALLKNGIKLKNYPPPWPQILKEWNLNKGINLKGMEFRMEVLE